VWRYRARQVLASGKNQTIGSKAGSQGNGEKGLGWVFFGVCGVGLDLHEGEADDLQSGTVT